MISIPVIVTVVLVNRALTAEKFRAQVNGENRTKNADQSTHQDGLKSNFDFGGNHLNSTSADGKTLLPSLVAALNHENEAQKDRIPISRWILLAPALPTILLFVTGVVAIAIKIHLDDQRNTSGLPNEYALRNDEMLMSPRKESTKSIGRRKQSKEMSRRAHLALYDAMLRNHQSTATRRSKAQFTRKSSQVVIPGLSLSRSPRSLARKHILMEKLSHDSFNSDSEYETTSKLLKLSAHAFIGAGQLDNAGELESTTEAIPFPKLKSENYVAATVPDEVIAKEGVVHDDILSEKSSEDKYGKVTGLKFERKRGSLVIFPVGLPKPMSTISVRAADVVEDGLASRKSSSSKKCQVKSVSEEDVANDPLLEYAVLHLSQPSNRTRESVIGQSDGSRTEKVLQVNAAEDFEAAIDDSQLSSNLDKRPNDHETPHIKGFSRSLLKGSKALTRLERLKEPSTSSEHSECSVHIRTILDQSREDLSEARKILPDDVNEVLLPEDFEEAFASFCAWRESLL